MLIAVAVASVWSFRLMASFSRRRDNQIMGLELAAISLGLSTFAEWLGGRKVTIHCDNSGAEVCTWRACGSTSKQLHVCV